MSRARLRLLAEDADVFPDWWHRTIVESVFDLVTSRADVTMLAMPDWTWTAADLDTATARAEDHPEPTGLYYRFDSWDDPSRGWRGEPAWADSLHRYCRTATVVAGPQLPLVDGPEHCVALPYGPLVTRTDAPPGLAGARTDVQFAGFWLDPGWAAPPTDTRDRHHRGYLIRQLSDGLAPDRLAIRHVEYWGGDDDERAHMRACAATEMDRSRMVLAPSGYGYLTFRHSDAWARGRALLCEPVQRHIRVPEPERWADGDIAVLYDPAADDLAQVVAAALDEPERLTGIAAAGWEYGRRWTTPESQLAALADALASHV